MIEIGVLGWHQGRMNLIKVFHTHDRLRGMHLVDTTTLE